MSEFVNLELLWLEIVARIEKRQPTELNPHPIGLWIEGRAYPDVSSGSRFGCVTSHDTVEEALEELHKIVEAEKKWFSSYGRPVAVKKRIFHDSDLEPNSSPEALEWLRSYVQRKLIEGGISPDEADPLNPTSVAANIVADTWRQFDRKHYADMRIESAIKYPPEPINEKHFSLKAFAKLRKS
jgi:hypothetical protein